MSSIFKKEILPCSSHDEWTENAVKLLNICCKIQQILKAQKNPRDLPPPGRCVAVESSSSTINPSDFKLIIFESKKVKSDFLTSRYRWVCHKTHFQRKKHSLSSPLWKCGRNKTGSYLSEKSEERELSDAGLTGTYKNFCFIQLGRVGMLPWALLASDGVLTASDAAWKDQLHVSHISLFSFAEILTSCCIDKQHKYFVLSSGEIFMRYKMFFTNKTHFSCSFSVNTMWRWQLLYYLKYVYTFLFTLNRMNTNIWDYKNLYCTITITGSSLNVFSVFFTFL